MPKLASLIVDIRSNTAKFNQGMDRAERKLNKFHKSSQQLGRGLLALGGAAGIAYVIKQSLDLADAYNVLQSRIRNATRDTGDYLAVTERLNKVSGITGSNLADTVDVFQRLTQSRQDLNATNDELLDLTELVQKLGVVSGASGQAMSAGLLQFGQGLSAGVFRAEEFNSIVENLPAVASTLAKALGKSPGELRKMVLEGKLLSSDVMTALLSQAEDINSQFEEMPDSMKLAGTSLSNSFSRFLGQLDQAAEGTGLIAKTMREITESLDYWSDALQAPSNLEAANDQLDQAKQTLIDLQKRLEITQSPVGVIGEWLYGDQDALKKQIATAEADVRKFQENVLTVFNKQGEGTDGGGETKPSPLGFKPEDIQKDLDKLAQGILSAEEIENARYLKAQETLQTARELNLETIRSYDELEAELKTQHDEVLTDLEIQHWDEIKRIREKNMTDLDRFAQMSWKKQTKIIVGQIVAMTQGVAQGSKIMFNINKAAAATQAILNTHEAVSSAYKWGTVWGGPAGGAAMAAIAGAAQVARVASILGTSFGGGSSAPSLSGAGGGATTVNTVDVTGPTAPVQTSTLVVNLGDFDVAALPETTLRTLLTQIEDARSDMGDATQVIYA